MKKQRKEKRIKRKAAARKRMIEYEAYLDYIRENTAKDKTNKQQTINNYKQ